MKKCYVALLVYEEESEILGIFSSLADAEERCLAEHEDDIYNDFLMDLLWGQGIPLNDALENSKYNWQDKRDNYRIEEHLIF